MTPKRKFPVQLDATQREASWFVLLSKCDSGDQINKNEMGLSHSTYKGGAYKNLVGRPEGNEPLRRPRRRWEDNIKTDLHEVRKGGMDWIDLALNGERYRAVVNEVMNPRIP
jgi:hypothetical protein